MIWSNQVCLLGTQGRHGVLQPRVPAAAHHDRGVEGEVRARGAADGASGGGPGGGGGAAGRPGLRQGRRDARRGLRAEATGGRGARWLACHALLLHTHTYAGLVGSAIISYVLCSSSIKNYLMLLCSSARMDFDLIYYVIASVSTSFRNRIASRPWRAADGWIWLTAHQDARHTWPICHCHCHVYSCLFVGACVDRVTKPQ